MFFKISFLILFFSFLQAQKVIPIKIDDFDSNRSWWLYHRDGSVKNDPKAIINGMGYLKLSLQNPLEEIECNVGISDHQPIYSKQYKILSSEIRLKVLTDMKDGSRGWGFWKTAGQGKADYLAWFMEQLFIQEPSYSWKRVGIINKSKRDFTTFNTPVNRWITYKIERDLNLNITRFYEDQKIIFQSKESPQGDMSFHLWIDNQVYKSGNIKRSGWDGKNEMIVDYIKISTGNDNNFLMPPNDAIILGRNIFEFAYPGQESLLNEDIFLKKGNYILIANVKAEAENEYLKEDLFEIQLNPLNKKLIWEGNQTKGASYTKSALFYTDESKINVKSISKNTPMLESILLINLVKSNILIDEDINDYVNKKEPSGLWKKIAFSSKTGKILLIITGSAKESPGFNHINTDKMSDQDDDNLRIVIDDNDFKWNSYNSLDGNKQFGLSKSIILEENLLPGEHTLNLYVKNQPHIGKILLIEKND